MLPSYYNDKGLPAEVKLISWLLSLLISNWIKNFAYAEQIFVYVRVRAQALLWKCSLTKSNATGGNAY